MGSITYPSNAISSWTDQVTFCFFSFSNMSQDSWLHEELDFYWGRMATSAGTTFPGWRAMSRQGWHGVVETPGMSSSHEWECCSWGKPQHPSNVFKCRACPEVYQVTVRTLCWQLLESFCDCNGMFSGASLALLFLHFLTGCSQQVSLDFLKAEYVLSVAALHSLGQASCDTFHLSYIIFIQILTANCMRMYFLTANKSFHLLLFNKRHIPQGMRNKNFYQWLSYVCYLVPAPRDQDDQVVTNQRQGSPRYPWVRLRGWKLFPCSLHGAWTL